MSRRGTLGVVIAYVMLTVSVTGPAALTATPDDWPTTGWRVSTPEQQGMDTGKLAEMVEHIQQQEYAIDSVTIIRNGFLVLDAYFYPFQKGLTHPLFSCTKSVTSALIGIALEKGHLVSVTQPIHELFPQRTIANVDARKRAITLEHLLTMASGLDCRDSYKYQWAGLHALRQSADWAQSVLDLPMTAEPGARFEYCNGVSYLLSVILQQATGMRALDFARTHLFGPLGITEGQWRTSPQDVNIGWSDMWLTPYDMAKIGWLYLNRQLASSRPGMFRVSCGRIVCGLV